MDDLNTQKFKTLLESNHQFPGFYSFKLIFKTPELIKLKESISHHQIVLEKKSGKGNYTSVTTKLYVTSADEVIREYQLLGSIKGVMVI